MRAFQRLRILIHSPPIAEFQFRLVGNFVAVDGLIELSAGLSQNVTLGV